MNPYIEFVKNNYQKVKAENTGMKPTDVMRKVAAMYRAQKKGAGKMMKPAVWKEPLIVD